MILLPGTAIATAALLLLNDVLFVSAQQTMVNGGTVDLTTCETKESNFNIQLEYMGAGGIDDRYTEAFESAAARWSKVIVGDLQNAPPVGVTDWFDGTFAEPYLEEVDDVVIGYDIPDTIDGPGGTLGTAGATFVRRDAQGNPTSTVSGTMQFDGADLAEMTDEDVKAIIQHEMGHVLGLVGTTTGRCLSACDAEASNERANYGCPLASNEYDNISIGSDLELENDGGVGTACGHWEEDSFRTTSSSEVMTGFFEADKFQPISSVTVAGLEDLGYEVDYCGADIWPATEDSIKKFEVYKTAQEMEMDAVMAILMPSWMVDAESGEKFPFEFGIYIKDETPLIDDGKVDETPFTGDEEVEGEQTNNPDEQTNNSDEEASGAFSRIVGKEFFLVTAAAIMLLQ